MKQQQINIDPALIDELAKSIKSEKDLAVLSKQLGPAGAHEQDPSI